MFNRQLKCCTFITQSAIKYIIKFPDWVMVDFDALKTFILSQKRGWRFSIHGPKHWQRVETNALAIAQSNGADILVVRLFALFHDSKRKRDWGDRLHGYRAAEFLYEIREEWLPVTDEQFTMLHYAVKHHTDGMISDNPTIGACWDADRLDLTRVGISPKANFMSTEYAKSMCKK